MREAQSGTDNTGETYHLLDIPYRLPADHVLSTFSLETRPYSRREKRTEHDPRIPHRPPTRRCRPGKEKEKRPIGTISIRGTRP